MIVPRAAPRPRCPVSAAGAGWHAEEGQAEHAARLPLQDHDDQLDDGEHPQGDEDGEQLTVGLVGQLEVEEDHVGPQH